jgi:DNA-binding transcriptional regulator/RsmH inhibitor MraZ
MLRGVVHTQIEEGRLVLPDHFADQLRMRTVHLCAFAGRFLSCISGPEALRVELEDDIRSAEGTTPGIALVYLGITNIEDGILRIPESAARLAGLGPGAVVVVGMGRRFEVWDPARWEEEMEALMM